MASFKNRNLELPENRKQLYEIEHQGEATQEVEFLPHTDTFRFDLPFLFQNAKLSS